MRAYRVFRLTLTKLRPHSKLRASAAQGGNEWLTASQRFYGD